MALKHILIALTCAVALPAVALAQSPVQKMAAMADCCATDDGTAAAAAVLLPPLAVMPTAACCPADPKATAPAADHTAHGAPPAAKPATPATHAMADMACCDHGAKQAGATADAGCCQDMKEGCGMGCCGATPPKR